MKSSDSYAVKVLVFTLRINMCAIQSTGAVRGSAVFTFLIISSFYSLRRWFGLPRYSCQKLFQVTVYFHLFTIAGLVFCQIRWVGKNAANVFVESKWSSSQRILVWRWSGGKLSRKRVNNYRHEFIYIGGLSTPLHHQQPNSTNVFTDCLKRDKKDF